VYLAGVPGLERPGSKMIRTRLTHFLNKAVARYTPERPIVSTDHVAYMILHLARRRYTTRVETIQLAMSRTCTEVISFYFGKNWLPVWQKMEKMLTDIFSTTGQGTAAFQPIVLHSKQRSAEFSQALRPATLQTSR
jgi:hypothetical protein